MNKKNKKPFWMICKVQVSISGEPSTLIYNESRSFCHQCEREFGVSILDDDLKGFFKIRFNNGELYIHERVNDKEW